MGMLPQQEWSYTRVANLLFSGSPGEDALLLNAAVINSFKVNP